MLISLTVGKVDAGVAVLLTEDKRLIEFPSILLPSSIASGSIVDITVSRNISSEAASQKAFSALQSSILNTYGLASPSSPVLRCRNATQTSIVLEWDKLSLATASLRSLSLYRNGSKAGLIPRAATPGAEVQATKVSGLAVDTEYVFHLVLRTSAGVYTSEKLSVKTHKMTDLSGITVTPGALPPPLRESLGGAVERIGAKIADTVRIDTTHFVCTEGRGHEWERALEMNIPIVRPEWLEGCEREGRIVGVRGYYLNADPKTRVVGQGVNVQGQQHQNLQAQHRQQSAPTPDHGSQRTMPVQEQPATPGQSERLSSVGSDAAPPPPAKDQPHRETADDKENEEEDGDDEDKDDDEAEEQRDRESSPDSPKKNDREKGTEKDSAVPPSTDEPKTPAENGNFSEVQL